MIITLKLFREGSTVATCRTRSEICQVAELYSWRICAFGCSNMLCGSISISRFGCTKPPRTIYDCSCLHLPTVFGFVIRFYRTKQFTVNSSICCSWQFSDRWTGGTAFEIEFCTGAGAGMSRGSPAGFPAGSGLKFRKIPRYKRERDCKLRGSSGSGINVRGTPVGMGSRPHGEFRYVVLKVWCLLWTSLIWLPAEQIKSRASVPVLSVTPLQWQWHLYL